MNDDMLDQVLGAARVLGWDPGDVAVYRAEGVNPVRFRLILASEMMDDLLADWCGRLTTEERERIEAVRDLVDSLRRDRA